MFTPQATYGHLLSFSLRKVESSTGDAFIVNNRSKHGGDYQAPSHHERMVFDLQQDILDNVYDFDNLEWPFGQRNKFPPKCLIVKIMWFSAHIICFIL